VDADELPDGSVAFKLSKSEALVLFDWIHRLEDEDGGLIRLGFADQAEQRVVWDLSTSLERLLAEPFRDDYLAIINAARSQVRDPTE
jgi:hypothetical protein